MSFKPIDPKRDEFRRYLEHAGVVEALTKVFVRLIKDRPENPMEYLQHNLGDTILQADYMAYLNSELQEARTEIQRLRSIIENIDPNALTDIKEGSSKSASTTNTVAVENEDLNPELNASVSNETASPASLEETQIADPQAVNIVEEQFKNVNIEDNAASSDSTVSHTGNEN